MPNPRVQVAAEGLPIRSYTFLTTTDRMAEAAEAYRQGLVRQNEEMARTDISEKDKDAYYGIHLAPLRAVIEEETPVPTTLAGAVAAIRFVAEDSDWVQKDHARVLVAALAFLQNDRPAPGPIPSCEGFLKADPLLDFVNLWSRLSEQLSDVPDGEVDTFYNDQIAPLELLARDGPLPAATTAAGAAAALEKAISFGDMEGQDANLICAALAFLTRSAIPEPFDPFLELLTRYRRQMEIWEATKDLTDDEFEALGDKIVSPLFDELICETPSVTTLHGAVEGIRSALAEQTMSEGTYLHSVLTAVLAYFDGRAK